MSIAALTFTGRHANSNLVTNAAVSLPALAGNNIFDAACRATDGNGVFLTTLASTLAQSEDVMVMVNLSFALYVKVKFVPGLASIPASSLMLSATTQVADNSNAIVAVRSHHR